jgi:hypothetical protein
MGKYGGHMGNYGGHMGISLSDIWENMGKYGGHMGISRLLQFRTYGKI